jgi:hypothetical protein
MLGAGLFWELLKCVATDAVKLAPLKWASLMSTGATFKDNGKDY